MFKDFVSTIHRIELFFFQYYFKNGTFEKMTPKKSEPSDSHDPKNWTSFSNLTQRVESFFSKYHTKEFKKKNVIWLKELNSSSQCDSENQTFFSLFWVCSLNPILILTLRIELFQYLKIFSIEFTDLHPFRQDSKNWTGFPKFDSKNWTFSGIWLNGLNPLHKRTQRIGPKKIIWLQQPNFFYDSRNWTCFSISKNWAFFKNITQVIGFFNMTHRIELLTTWHYSQNWTLFY